MILFFDTETTGIRKDGHIPRVVQLGALLTDNAGRTMGELNLLLIPEGFENVPEAASNVHGITFEMLQQYGCDRTLGLVAFFELMRHSSRIVAHNIGYDLDLLDIEIDYTARNHSEDYAVAFSRVLASSDKYCTMKESKNVCKVPLSDKQLAYFKSVGRDTNDYKNPSLQQAYMHFFNKDFEGAHDAMADVRACRDVYFELNKKGGNGV